MQNSVFKEIFVCSDTQFSTNLFGFFGFDRSNWATSEQIYGTINFDSVPAEFWLGGVTYDENGDITKASTLRLLYSTEGSDDDKVCLLFFF